MFLASILSAALTLASTHPQQAIDLHFRIFQGSTAQSVKSATIWLISYSWNGGDTRQVGAVEDGEANVHIRASDLTWSLQPPDSYHDNYLIGIKLPGDQWYITRTLNHNTLFSNISSALTEIGGERENDVVRDGLVLPARVIRRVQFLDLRGRPVARFRVGINLHVSDMDHCGWEQGPWIGWYVTDTKGAISFRYPPSPLTVWAPWLQGKSESWGNLWTPIGTRSTLTLRNNWGWPWTEWRLKVADATGKPMRGARVRAYSGVGCGDVEEAVVDNNGTARVRVVPSTVRWIEIDAGKSKRSLTPGQIRELTRSGWLHWVAPADP